MVEVKLRGVGKSFGTTKVLEGIDAEIADGAFAVLVGPSGCGKSTLLRVIAGLEEVSAGTIHFGERDVTALAPRDRDIAMVFQSYALYPHMTVRQNLAFGLELRKTDKKIIERRVRDVAKTLELELLLDRHPRALSGGQRQRVAMGRAIVRRPAVFMFDEPLSNLDPALRNQVRVDIRKLHDELGATSIYVTHDQVEAMTLADELFVLDKGIVQQRGRPIDIYNRPANRFVAGFLGSPAMNFAHGHLTQTGGTPGVVLGEGGGAASIPLRNSDAFGSLEPGREVTVGIRPHDLRLVSDATADITLEADFVETLGSHVNVHADLAGAPFIAALEGTRGPTKGDRIALHIEELHLFDATSGESLRASP
jgi:multiple sugar transport system ATP-binding protein